MRISLVHFIILFSTSVFCQEVAEHPTKTITGRIVSSDDNLPIPSAHVYLINSTIGTVTNNAGEFSLKVLAGRQNEIQISSIGFKSIAIRISENSNEALEIKLQPATTTLKEVVVSATEVDSGKYILQTAIKFAKFNYPHKTHILDGFFRETSFIDTLYNRLIEAAVRVQEVGYKKNTYDNENLEFTRNRVEIIEIRKSDDFRETDKFSEGMHKMFGDRNGLYQIFDYNFAKAIDNNSSHPFSRKNIFRYDINYVGRTEYENQQVYILELKRNPPKFFQWENATFYINQADFAILKIQLDKLVNPSNEKIDKAYLIDEKYWYQAEVNYRKINYHYYPFYISSKHSASDASYVVEKDGIKLKQYVSTQFLLTQLYDDDFSKIKWKNTEDRNIDLYKNEMPYNADFWNNYNVIKLNPLNRVPTELEKEKSLEAQFKKEDKN